MFGKGSGSRSTRQRGGIAVMTGVLLVALLGFTAFAVDLGYIYAERSRLQTSADLAALAGAGAMLGKGNSVAMQPECATEAVTIGHQNLKSHHVPGTALTTTDVVFMRDFTPTTANPNQVQVTVTCSQARGNPINLFFARVLGTDWTDLSATAVATVVSACGSRCLKPVVLPTKFTYNDDCTTDPKLAGNGFMDAECPSEMNSCQAVGFTEADKGTELILKYGNQNHDNREIFASGLYSPVDLPPVNKGTPVPGASMYEANLGSTDCSDPALSNYYFVEPGDELQLEPGAMTGPTNHGLDALTATDPGADWVKAPSDAPASDGYIDGSAYEDPALSPRVARVAFFNPCLQTPESGRTTLRVHQVMSVFFDSIDNQNDIIGYIYPTSAIGASQSCIGGLLSMVRLEQ